MSVSPVSDESVFSKWSSVSKLESSGNFSHGEMKGPSNVSVRLDLFPEPKGTDPVKRESNESAADDGEDMKNIKRGDEYEYDDGYVECDFSKWNDTEQLNNQVVFINPEWDEIEEEKAGIPAFLNSITPTVSGEKPVPAQVTEFVVTDTESVSSVTVSLDEFAEESEEIVAVISDSEAEVIQADLLTQMDGARPTEEKKLLDPLDADAEASSLHIRNWTETDPLKSPLETVVDPIPIIVSQSEAKPIKLLTPPPPEVGKRRPTNEGLLDASKLMKASCYVMQNGKITKPFYIVKNPILREDAIYKNINKPDDVKRGYKLQNGTAVNEEDRNILSLGRTSVRKKDLNFREPQIGKFGRNQEFIRIIEHPAATARAKKIIVNKIGDSKSMQPGSGGHNGNSGTNTTNNYHHHHVHHHHSHHHSHHFHHHSHPEVNPKRPSHDPGEVFRRTAATDPVGGTCEGEDLMWLLDFKLDDLFSESSLPALSQLDDSLEQYTEFPGKFVDVDGSVSNFSESDADNKIRVEIGCQTETMTTRPNKLPNTKLTGKQQSQHKIEGKSDPTLPSRTFSDLKCSENRKPPFTYTELIECALQEKGPLTVSEIYNWISETFPYYKSWDDRWKNSVRHNLSINPYFRKGTKARQGSGHLWTVNKSEDNSKINNWKRHRFHEFEEFSKRLRYTGEVEKQETSECVSPHAIMDETELATASIEDKENRRLHRDVLMAACIENNFISTTNVSLEQSAEEILSGVKKNVEVQYLEPVKSPCEDDFLNPISKEILMGECGLLNQIELNLTAETGEHLSIVDSMTDAEHIFGIPDELNFHYDMPNHAPQLLPLAK
ncbi:hypothetical protein RUM44_007782 [Polyplax serrata]|uniref:Fork-head domain-containing protein n=1 Tax=Polyplax serrata TaxID=468196 RepID=A0ABR1B780_POLSC